MSGWKNFYKGWVVGSPLDLKKLFPDYFNKWVLRSSSILMFLLLLFTAYSNDWTWSFYYVDCPTSSESCITPDNIILLGGECYGQCPNGLARHFAKNLILILLNTLLINHIIYYSRTGKIVPKPNKKAWKNLRKWEEE